ncbi:hypothetical protein RI049_09630 [Cedecea neteri]|uniref:hypothetical protein n=1 Tax=Cedecea neteri TaxID=158822 RepID=UPI002AA61CF0|nr:hypothetical protein [Cedecea neteri]WPU24973.1 hypothetical protein RI049_09630 [Cedecea neteri]
MKRLVVAMSNNTEAHKERVTDEQLQELITFAGLSGFGDIGLALSELSDMRRRFEGLQIVGYVQSDAWNKMNNRGSRFCALWPVEERLQRRRPRGLVAVYARCVGPA